MPCVGDQGVDFSISIILPDPFFIEYLTAIVRTNQGKYQVQYENDFALKD
jgi:hypothetical protein